MSSTSETADIQLANRLNIGKSTGYRCPECGFTWSVYTKIYAGKVYCQNRKSYRGGKTCNCSFKAEEITYPTYSIWELCDGINAKSDMINILERALKDIKDSK